VISGGTIIGYVANIYLPGKHRRHLLLRADLRDRHLRIRVALSELTI